MHPSMQASFYFGGKVASSQAGPSKYTQQTWCYRACMRITESIAGTYFCLVVYDTLVPRTAINYAASVKSTC